MVHCGTAACLLVCSSHAILLRACVCAHVSEQPLLHGAARPEGRAAYISMLRGSLRGHPSCMAWHRTWDARAWHGRM